MCHLDCITTNQGAIAALFVSSTAMSATTSHQCWACFPDYPASVIRNSGGELEMTMMRWGKPPPRYG